jgi:hypothetical protein
MKKWRELLFLAVAALFALLVIHAIEDIISKHAVNNPTTLIEDIEIAVLSLLFVSYALDEFKHLVAWIRTPPTSADGAPTSHGTFGFRQVFLILTSAGGSLALYVGFKNLLEGKW